MQMMSSKRKECKWNVRDWSERVVKRKRADLSTDSFVGTDLNPSVDAWSHPAEEDDLLASLLDKELEEDE